MSIDVNITEQIVEVNSTNEIVEVNVTNGPGPVGPGVAPGGTTGPILKKQSNLDYDTYWTSESVGLTSVGMSMPSGFVVSNSPLTSNGTISVSGAGNTLQYLDGTGNLQTFPLTLPVLQQVRNQTGSSVSAGTVVYINGATGNLPTIAKAIATGDPTSAQTLGMVQGTIANNGTGYVVVIGTCGNLDTSAYSEGQQLYLSGTVAGGVTTTKPYAPIHLVYIGIVTRQHPTLGTIEVRVQNGAELEELHNVSAQNPNNNDGIFYNTSTSLWEHKQISTVLGYTPEQPLTFTTPLARVTNTISIPQATGSVSGFLSSTDWSTFNSKQGALTLTTTGTSGAATLVGNTLNIPQYSGTNIYNSDGTLTGNRTVTMGSFTLSFEKDVTFNGARLGRGLGQVSNNLSFGTNFNANTTGQHNYAFGYGNLTSLVGGNRNTAIGINVNQANVSSWGNIGIGFQPLLSNIGGNNVAVGNEALLFNTSGNDNVALGKDVFRNNTTGSGNIGIGTFAGAYIADSSTANAITNNSIFIGYNAKPLANNQTNQIVIGYGSTGLGSNTTIIGNSSTTDTAIYGRMLVNYASPVIGTYALDVNGTGRFTDTITNTGTYFQIPNSNGLQIGFFSNNTPTTKSNISITNSGTGGSGTAQAFPVMTGLRNIFMLGTENPGGVGSPTISGNDNLILGRISIDNPFSGSKNILIYSRGLISTGNGNTGIGYNALNGITTGSNNLHLTIGEGVGNGSFTSSLSNSIYIGDPVKTNNYTTVAGDIVIATTYTASTQFWFGGKSDASDVYFNIPVKTGTNQTGWNTYWRASIGTGTGEAGKIFFQHSTPTTTGTTIQSSFTNTLTLERLSIYTASNVSFSVGASANASAILQADSVTRGFLPPRMTSTQRGAISTPATGLVVYQTDSTEGLYQYKSTGWEAIGGGGTNIYNADGTLTGNRIVTSGGYTLTFTGNLTSNGNVRATGVNDGTATGKSTHIDFVSASNYGRVQVYDYTAGTTLPLFFSASEVSIGTGSLPAASGYQLNVNGTSNTLFSNSGDINVTLRSSATTSSQIFFQQSTTERFWMGYVHPIDAFRIYNTGTSSASMSIFRSTNNITIGGTTDAGYKLDVQGTFRTTGAATLSSLGVGTNALNASSSGVSIGTSVDPTRQFLIRTATTVAFEIQSTAPETKYEIRNNGQTHIADGNAGSGGGINASALLQLSTTTRGFLPPRMTETQKNAISTPATGLVIYQTDGTEGLYQYKSTGWSQVSGTGGGGGITRSVNTISTNTTAGAAATTDYVYLISGTTTLTLPTAVGNTNRYTLKNVGTNTVTINTTSSQTIDGSTSLTMSVRYTALDVISDGTNWNII